MKHERLYYVKQLVLHFPHLNDAIQENLLDFPEAYLHLIFGDIFVPYLLELLNSAPSSEDALICAGNMVEEMAVGDEYAQEVVVTTILEPLTDNPAQLYIFEKYAGPQTKTFIKQIL